MDMQAWDSVRIYVHMLCFVSTQSLASYVSTGPHTTPLAPTQPYPQIFHLPENLPTQKPHEALNLLLTEECFLEPFYMLFYTLFTQFAECKYRLQIKLDYSKKKKRKG
jgi:hypothetical protein